MILTTSNFRDVALWAVAKHPTKHFVYGVYTGDTLHFGWRRLDNGDYLNGYEVEGWEIVGVIGSDGKLEEFPR